MDSAEDSERQDVLPGLLRGIDMGQHNPAFDLECYTCMVLLTGHGHFLHEIIISTDQITLQYRSDKHTVLSFDVLYCAINTEQVAPLIRPCKVQ